MLSKATDLTTRLGADTQALPLLLQALVGAGAMIGTHCRRVLEYAAANIVAYFDGDSWDLRLNCYPVYVPSTGLPADGLLVVKEASDYGFAGATALVADIDYRVNLARGILTRLPDGARWMPGVQTVQVSWRGGYCDPATSPAPTGVSYVPAHIQEACLIQAVELYKRRLQPGEVLGGNMAGGLSITSMAATDLLPSVERILRAEVRK